MKMNKEDYSIGNWADDLSLFTKLGYPNFQKNLLKGI